MSSSASDPLNQLPPALQQQLQTYQRQRGLDNLADALVEALQHYFILTDPRLGGAIAQAKQAEELEKRINQLTREVVFLRQEFAKNADRLREQLATVRLSHSGLLHNLRDRIEVLEQAVIAGGPAALELSNLTLEATAESSDRQATPAADPDPSLPPQPEA